MAAVVKVHVEGLAELQGRLRELPDATAKNVLRRVGRKRLQPIADRAVGLVPLDKGDLRDSIGVSTKLTRRQRGKHRKFGRDDVEVFAGAGPHPQAHMQEFGTEHNGPQAFMRPAWDAGKDELLAGIGADFWEEIERAAKRKAKKAAKAAAGAGD
jgi:HK97 gp10 family phage protein